MAQFSENPDHKSWLAERLEDASIDCILSLDTDLRVTSWNTMCEKQMGLSRHLLIGKEITEALPPVRRLPHLIKGLQNALRGFKSFVPAAHGSFEGEHMESHIVPLREEDGTVGGMLVIRHDVAHRQKAEEELKRLNEALAGKALELEQRNAELITFGKITSHDLKEPLRKINVFGDMLLSREGNRLSEEGHSILERLKKSALKAERLTDDIFSFSVLQQVAEPLEAVPLDDILKLVRGKLKNTLTEKAATLTINALPTVNGYRILLQKLFQNLIDNSLKFCRSGTPPHISIDAGQGLYAGSEKTQNATDQIYQWLRVTDNGIGFEARYANLVFELFEQLHPPAAYEGNGIGLALCRKIMHLHGGFITGQSAPGAGSAFTCYFPA